MALNVKPVFILSREAGVFIDPDGRMEVLRNGERTRDRIAEMLAEMRGALGRDAALLDELLVGDPSGFAPLFSSRDEIDVVLLCFLGVTPLEPLLRWKGPMIAFSGQHTPAMALYALGEERHVREDLFLALDYKDIDRRLRLLSVKKSLGETRIVLFGFPAPWHLRWYATPDFETIRRKTGMQFTPVELRELLDVVEEVDEEKAASLARQWMDEADQVLGPASEDVTKSAVVYIALDRILTQKGAHAMAINCLEITQSRKFRGRMTNPCLAMSVLRDKDIPSACEMDIAALLTMILLGKLSKKPSFLGNIVRVDPERNEVKISHCILPSRMAGFDAKPLPYALRDFHGDRGVTAFTKVPAGTRVTLARAHRNLERMLALTGEVVASEDTVFCRNTLTIKVENGREFVQQAEGNHHVVVFGEYLEDLQELCRLLHCEFRSL